MDDNQAIYERDARDYASTRLLMPSERKVLALLGDRWSEIEMLDLGIGCGRTTYTFAAVAKRYVGIDYSPRMIELARQLIGNEDERVQLGVADARDLTFLERPFDFVLFSFNGLDSVGHEDRLRILAEVRRLLRPDGTFLFSAHSLNALPFTSKQRQKRPWSWRGPLHVWLNHLAQLARTRKMNRAMKKLNRELDVESGRARGWMVARDLSHQNELRLYYVDPAYQVAQLRDAGFELIAAYGLDGREVDPSEAGNDPWLHYYCRTSPTMSPR